MAYIKNSSFRTGTEKNKKTILPENLPEKEEIIFFV